MKFFEYLLSEANHEYTAIMVYYIISYPVCLAARQVDRVLLGLSKVYVEWCSYLQLTVHVTDLTLGSAPVFVDSARPGMCRLETGSIFPPNKAVFGLARNLSASQKRVSEREAGARGPQGAAACVRYRHRLTVYNFENPVHLHRPNRSHPLFTKDRVFDSHRAITIDITILSISVGIDTSVQVASEGFEITVSY